MANSWVQAQEIHRNQFFRVSPGLGVLAVAHRRGLTPRPDGNGPVAVVSATSGLSSTRVWYEVTLTPVPYKAHSRSHGCGTDFNSRTGSA